MSHVQTVDDRLGRTGTLLDNGGEVTLPEDRLVGGNNGRSPPLSTQRQASRKFLVNMVGSDLCRTSSFTWPAAKK